MRLGCLPKSKGDTVYCIIDLGAVGGSCVECHNADLGLKTF